MIIQGDLDAASARHDDRSSSRCRPSCLSPFALLLAACTGEEPRGMPALAEADAVLVQPGSLVLQAGADAQLAAQVNDEKGEAIGGAHIRFEAEDPQLLRVTATGRVSALGRAVEQTYVHVKSGARETRVPVAVRPGPPRRFAPLVELRRSVTAGTSLPQQAAARLLDDWGNPLPGIAVRVERPDADAAGEEVTTDADGRVTIPWPAPTSSGTVRLVLWAAGPEAPRIEFSLDVQAGPPAGLTLERADPRAAGERQAGSPVAVTARVEDAFGNPVGGQPLRMRVASAGDLPWVGTQTGADGVAHVSLSPAGEARPMRIEAEIVGPDPLRTVLVIENTNESVPQSARRAPRARPRTAR